MTFHLKRDMYVLLTTVPLPISSVINNVEDTVAFIPWKIFTLGYFSSVSETRNAQVLVLEKPQMKIICVLKTKTWIFVHKQTQLLRVSFWIAYATLSMEGQLKLHLYYSPFDMNMTKQSKTRNKNIIKYFTKTTVMSKPFPWSIF